MKLSNHNSVFAIAVSEPLVIFFFLYIYINGTVCTIYAACFEIYVLVLSESRSEVKAVSGGKFVEIYRYVLSHVVFVMILNS